MSQMGKSLSCHFLIVIFHIYLKYSNLYFFNHLISPICFFPDEQDILIAGDFNLDPSAEHFQWLSNAGFTNVLPPSYYTNISTKNMEGSQCYDNLWLSQKLHGIHTGKILSNCDLLWGSREQVASEKRLIL